jgi:hypothetical protein
MSITKEADGSITIAYKIPKSMAGFWLRGALARMNAAFNKQPGEDDLTFIDRGFKTTFEANAQRQKDKEARAKEPKLKGKIE